MCRGLPNRTFEIAGKAVPNIHFTFALVSIIRPDSIFVFGLIVKQD